jgi:hypothetical protein
MLRSLVVSPEKVSEDLTCLHLPSATVPMLHSCLWTTLLSDLGALVLLNMRISSSRASPVSVSLPMRLFSCRSESPSSTERRLRIVTDVMPVTPFRYFREPGGFPCPRLENSPGRPICQDVKSDAKRFKSDVFSVKFAFFLTFCLEYVGFKFQAFLKIRQICADFHSDLRSFGIICKTFKFARKFF